MKILRISLRNIASLAGTHTVDFTREPLRTAGLFSISGQTGSGKSTLLDALCLALYEKTPRLNLVRGTAKLTDGNESISQKDPANLLRRGTGEGFAEVAFVGVDQAIYTARWSVRRAHIRPDGALQNSEMLLLRGDIPPGMEGPIEQGGRKTEVLPVIAGKVGLSFEQFTRAVMLAQNDFATFLKADDRERAEILQALTGTERFEAISRAVFERCGTALRAVEDAKSLLTGSEPLSIEARTVAEAASVNAEAEFKCADEKVAARQTHADWFKKLAGLKLAANNAEAVLLNATAVNDAAKPRHLELEQTAEISHAARPLREAEKDAAQEVAAFERKRVDAAKADATARSAFATKKQECEGAHTALVSANTASEQAKPDLRLARALDAQLPPLAARLATLLSDRQAAEVLVKLSKGKRDKLTAERKAAEDELAAVAANCGTLAPLAPFATDAKAWLDRLDRASAVRTSLENSGKELERKSKTEKDKIAIAVTERKKASELHTATKAAASFFEKAENAVRMYDGEKSATIRQSATAAAAALRELQTNLLNLSALKTQCDGLTADLAKLKTAQVADEKKLADAQKRQIPAAEAARDSARRSYELAEAAVADDAIALREKLASEQPCPVCGAKEHPYSHHPPTAEGAALRALKKFRDECDKNLGVIRNQAATLAANCAARETTIAEKSAALANLTPRFEQASAVRHEHPAAVAVLALHETERTSVMEDRLKVEQAKIKAADDDDTARRKAEKHRDDCRVAHEKTAKACDEVDKKLGQLDAELAGLKATCNAAESARAAAETSYSTALAQLSPLFVGIAGTLPNWEHDGDKFRETFDKQTAELTTLNKRAGDLRSITERATAALAPVDETFDRAVTDLEAKQIAESTARNEHDTVKSQRGALFAGRAAEEIEIELADAGKNAADRHEKLSRELATAEKQIAAIAETLRAAGDALDEKTARHTTKTVALDEWLTAFAQRTNRTLNRTTLDGVLARDEAWSNAERIALNALEGAIQNARGALDVHKGSLESHTSARPTPDDETCIAANLATLHKALEEAKKLHDYARATILADDQRRTASSKLTADLESRRRSAQPWEQLNELIGSADGAKFRNIAQRRTMDILLGYANAQLEQLAQRYCLERIPESLNLIVVDRDMGDERRSVHSLSGGESFLVSLGLALGLASLTSNRLRIESLFIDEGFGSLDPETLNTAMSALMHLEAQGRKVGVISHVSEMADAIPVQIRVVKGRSGASRLIVPGAEPAAPLGGVSSDILEDSRDEQPDGSTEAVAADILMILRREAISGQSKVSVRALREEIGCSPRGFNTARDSLVGQISFEGRSLALKPDGGAD